MAGESKTIYLKNALVVTENDQFKGGVLIEGEKISRLITGDELIPGAETRDLDGKLLLPGLVDSHVHFNEPGRTDWEGYHTGSMAAAAGGVTTFLEMPLNSIPETLNKETLEQKRKAVESKSVVDYGHWGGLVDNNLSDLSEMHRDGVIGFKAFLSNSGIENFTRIDDDLLFAGLEEVKKLGNLLALHAENEYVTSYLGNKFRAEGNYNRAAWSDSRPAFTEVEAIRRACYWAGVSRANLHIVHVTTRDGFLAIEQAKKQGVKVTGETCPHYLSLTDDDFVEIGPAAKCAPPLRSQTEVVDLWQCVMDGLVDTIGSDHSPCTWDQKASGMENIWNAWGGISGIQTMLPVVLTEGVNKRSLPLTDLVRMMSANPARLFGLYPRKGSLNPGSDADIVVVDPNCDWTLSREDLFYRNPFSAFEGHSFTVKVLQTYVRGQLVFDGSDIKIQPGYGTLVKRSYKPE